MPLLVIGIAFLAFGVPAVTIAVLRHRRLKRIVSLGNVIEAQIVNVRQSRHVMINDSYPWQIVCYWQNPDTFQTHEFVSGFLNDDPHPALMWRGLTTLPVYFDPANPKDYHLDVSPLTEPQSLR
jgi:hypothetical protein